MVTASGDNVRNISIHSKSNLVMPLSVKFTIGNGVLKLQNKLAKYNKKSRHKWDCQWCLLLRRHKFHWWTVSSSDSNSFYISWNQTQVKSSNGHTGPTWYVPRQGRYLDYEKKHTKMLNYRYCQLVVSCRCISWKYVITRFPAVY